MHTYAHAQSLLHAQIFMSPGLKSLSSPVRWLALTHTQLHIHKVFPPLMDTCPNTHILLNAFKCTYTKTLSLSLSHSGYGKVLVSSLPLSLSLPVFHTVSVWAVVGLVFSILPFLNKQREVYL